MKLVEEPRAKVILIFPRLQELQFPLWAPLESFAISTALMNQGYEVTLIDMRVDEDARERLERELPDALFVGISTKFGDQLRNTLDVLAHVKSLRPDVPTLVGGWFPSLFPDSLFESPHVDLVAIGPGDFSAPELADRLLDGRSMEGLQGIWAREGERIVRNEFAHLPDIKRTHRIPWETVGIARYVHPEGWINAFTSRGCPGECNFCSIYCLDPRRWTAMEAQRVVDDLETLVGLGARAFKIMDTDFCADVKRVEAISREIVARGLDIRFEILGRHWNLRTMSDEQIRLLRRAGCTEIEMGVESGSQRLSDLVRKKLDVTELPDTARRFAHAGIRLKLNFMFGIPTETGPELGETLRLIYDLLEELGDDAIRLQLFRYTPLPGKLAQDDVWMEKPGAKAELSLDELAHFPVVEEEPERMFWITKRHERDVLSVYYFYAPLAFIPAVLDPTLGRPVWQRFLKLLRPLARWRIRNNFFRFPFEAWLNRRLGYAFRHGSDDGITRYADVLPPPVMGNDFDRREPLQPVATEA